MTGHLRWVTRMQLAGVILPAVAAAVLSYNAQLMAARTILGLSVWLAWLFPLAVDGPMLTASASLWMKALNGEAKRQAVWDWAILALFTVLSTAFNIAHAPIGSPENPTLIIPWLGWGVSVGQLMAAVPTLGLLVSFERLIAWLARRSTHVDPLTHPLIVEAPVHDHATGPRPEDATADDQGGAGPHRDAAGQRMGGQALDRRVSRADERGGSRRFYEQDDERRADHAVPPRAGGLGPVAAERGQPRVHGAGESGAGPDGVSPAVAGSPPVRLSIEQHLIDIIAHSGKHPDDIKLRTIIDDDAHLTVLDVIRERMGDPNLAEGSVRNKFAEARRKARTNGGVTVR